MNVMSAMNVLIPMGVQASLLIAVTAVLRRALGHRLPRRTFSILWMVCCFRLLVPAVPQWRFSFEALWHQALECGWVSGLAGGGNTFGGPGQPGGVWIEGTGAMELWPVDGVSGLSSRLGENAAAVVAAVWIAVALAMMGWFAATYVRYGRRFGQSLPLEEEKLRTLRATDLRAGMGRSVRIRVSDRVDAPLSYGLIRPVILFPATMDWNDREAAEHVIRHELVHIRRFDGIIKGILALTLCVYWWNPLVWLMYILANRDLEVACDQAVISGIGHERRADYAMTLIRMEESRKSWAVLCSHFSENAMEERIAAIMKTKKTSMIAVIAALCLVLGLTAVFATSAPEEDAEMAGADGQEYVDIDSAGADKTDSGVTGNTAGTLRWPGEGCNTVTMKFGRWVHPVTGEEVILDHITISDSKGKAEGSNVLAAAGGTVTATGFDTDKGYFLTIDHGNGLVTGYTHCRKVLVEEGQTVTQSQAVAAVGATGKVTGPCLGFYVYEDGAAVDPELYF